MQITRRQALASVASLLAARKAAPQSNVQEEIRAMADHAPLTMRFAGGSAGDCREWQRKFRAKLEELLGPHQPPDRWETIIERTVDLEDHSRNELLLRADGHPDLPIYVLEPRGSSAERRPGVLALHGHGKFGYDSVAGIRTTPEREKEIEEANYDYGLQLVRRGYVVAIPCFVPFGRRLDDREAYGGEDPCGVTFVRMQLLGKVLMSENLRDALWGLELLARHPGVDPGRIGSVGLSYGGRLAMLTSALSPKIRVTVISGALNVMQERIRGRYGCGAQVIPGLLKYGDVPEIAALIAPRPCLWEIGNRDTLMAKDWIQPALLRLRTAYQALGAPDMLDVDFFDGAHRWNGTRAFPLLAKWLTRAR